MRFSVVIPVYNVADYFDRLCGFRPVRGLLRLRDHSGRRRVHRQPQWSLCDALAARSPGRIG